MSNTHFGFKTVAEEEKSSLVRDVFDSVASRYDIMNDAMSFGAHRLWKREFVGMVDMRPNLRCLDVAGGTGDIAFRLLDKGAESVTVCDINEAMLTEGRARADNANRLKGIEFLCADAENLPLPASSFNLYTIAFGIRNVTHIDKVLSEAHRVLAPGGRFMCLEFSHVTHPLLAKAYDAYSFGLIPKMGKLIAGKAEPYQYLVESIRRFPTQGTFSQMIREAGFEQVRYVNLAGGAVAIHSGYKI
ncbi:MAG TPA: bifunctional demethylmenaquinone methyltransferase/2-methoxy-6-polyprenyl-1,4-benzoquinol methylase UbiE [Rickettsiales bacterium]|nr:bifunctional demethylmenaquinone methyltransferase/2-methoxy-6-polyprenyl-1,4-benzoquinol methylase UbiE [Rickettsiales bacterium]